MMSTSTNPMGAGARSGILASLGQLFARYGIVIALGLIVLALSVLSDNFLTSGNLTNVLRQESIFPSVLSSRSLAWSAPAWSREAIATLLSSLSWLPWR